MNISNKIIALRKHFDLTQKELGRIANVSGAAVSTWELGEKSPKVGPLLRICEHFEIDFYKFIDEDSDDLSDAFLSGQKESPAPGGAELTPTQQKAWEFIQQMDDEALERFIAAAKALMG